MFFFQPFQQYVGEENEDQYDSECELKLTNKSFKPFRDEHQVDDRRSNYSTSTMASIAPDVIRQRVKASISKRKKQADVKRIRLIV